MVSTYSLIHFIYPHQSYNKHRNVAHETKNHTETETKAKQNHNTHALTNEYNAERNVPHKIDIWIMDMGTQ